MNLHSLPEIGHLEYTQGPRWPSGWGKHVPCVFFPKDFPVEMSAYLWQYEYNGLWPCMDPMGTTPPKTHDCPLEKRPLFKRNLIFQPPFFGGTFAVSFEGD